MNAIIHSLIVFMSRVRVSMYQMEHVVVSAYVRKIDYRIALLFNKSY